MALKNYAIKISFAFSVFNQTEGNQGEGDYATNYFQQLTWNNKCSINIQVISK